MVPVVRKLAQTRLLAHAGRLLLGGFEFGFDRIRPGLRVRQLVVFGVDLPKPLMFLNGFVQERLRDGRVIDFAVPVPAIADHVDDDIAAKLVAVFESETSYADDCIHVLGVDVKYWDALPTRQLRGEAR